MFLTDDNLLIYMKLVQLLHGLYGQLKEKIHCMVFQQWFEK